MAIIMNYGKIIYYDTANGSGLRTSLFVSGCRHHCKGCFNQPTWDFDYGDPFTERIRDNILNSMKNPFVEGITLLGGEPMEPENQPCLLDLVNRLKKTFPDKTLWIYSGYLWEQLTGQITSSCRVETITDSILTQTDILVDGPFIQEKADLIGSPFRGSTNQRIIDVKQSLKQKQPILTKYMEG